MSIRVFAPAKINLTLRVGKPHADGLHPLQSVVTFADVGDVVEARESEALSLAIEGEFADGLRPDETNLVIRAARALAEAAEIAPRAALSLEKNLPVASGIGGGSSDAAATLHALNQLWALDYPAARLHDIARRLGADVPVCVGGAPAYMTGSGETWTPIALPAFSAVLVNPLQPLATSDVYRRFDAMGLGAVLPERATPSWPHVRAVLTDIAAIGNDLAASARELMPAIADVEAALSADGRSLYMALSGSGATVFALTADDETAASLADELQAAHPNWWVTDTRLGAA